MSKSLVSRPQRPALFDHPVMTMNPENMSLEDLHAAFSMIDGLQKVLAKRLKPLKERVKEVVQAEVEETAAVAKEEGNALVADNYDAYRDEKGSMYVENGGGQMKLEMRRSVKFDNDAVLRLLKEKGLEPKQGGSFVFVASEARLTALYSEGHITADELASVADIKETYAVKVKPVTAVAAALK